MNRTPTALIGIMAALLIGCHTYTPTSADRKHTVENTSEDMQWQAH